MTNELEKLDFPARLEALIDHTGLPKKVFAKNCGIKEKQLFVYLRGEAEPGMKALRGIKEYYPNVSIDWLISGIGPSYLEQKKPAPSTVQDIKYESVLNEFEDKDFAIKVNQALAAIEKLSMKVFYEVGGYIKRAAQEAKQEDQAFDEDRLTGTDDNSKK